MTRTNKKMGQTSPEQETTNNRISRVDNTITKLEQTIEQIQIAAERQYEKYERIISELKTAQNNTNEEIAYLRQLLNETDTKITIESARREREIQNVKNTKQEGTIIRANTIEMAMPSFSGDGKNEHPKNFIKDLNSYFTHKQITPSDKIIVIENCLKGKASKWFGMIKDTTPTAEAFYILF